MQLDAAGGVDWKAILAEIVLPWRGLAEWSEGEYFSINRKPQLFLYRERFDGEDCADKK